MTLQIGFIASDGERTRFGGYRGRRRSVSSGARVAVGTAGRRQATAAAAAGAGP